MKRSANVVASRANASLVEGHPLRIQFNSGAKQVATSSVLPLGARLGLCRLVELLEAGAEGEEGATQDGDQGHHDAVESTTLRQDDPEAVERQDSGLWPAEMRVEGRDNLLNPVVECMMAGHGGALRNHGDCSDTGIRRKSHATPKLLPQPGLEKPLPMSPS